MKGVSGLGLEAEILQRFWGFGSEQSSKIVHNLNRVPLKGSCKGYYKGSI